MPESGHYLQLQLPLLPLRNSAPRVPHRAPEAALHKRLSPLMRRPLAKIDLTNNRSTILTADSVAAVDGGTSVALRIHHCFVDAPESVLEAVGRFASGVPDRASRRRALATIREHFEASTADQPDDARDTAPRPIQQQPMGEFYNLLEIRDKLNLRFFEGGLDVAITWGRAPRLRGRRRRRSIQLGSYWEEDQLIRVHPLLDRQQVPRWVVESVVYHELLHAALPPTRTGRRRRVHTPEFRRREREFEQLDRANAWIARHLLGETVNY